MKKNQDMNEMVIFRKWKKAKYDVINGTIIALWPAVAADRNGNCNSYEHVGQHGGADYQGVIAKTLPATPKEYADLLAELKQIGYNPIVIKKATSKMRKYRTDMAAIS